MNPLVTICIPVYNGQKYLDECISSATSQTYENIEILLIDDCSQDNSIALIKMYQGKDSRIQYIINDRNIGFVNNWNKCIQNAKGNYIKFLFQDDFMEVGCVERMLQACLTNNTKLVICSRAYVFNDSSNISIIKTYTEDVFKLESVFSTPGFLNDKTILDIAQTKLLQNFIGEPIVLLFHKSILEKIGLFNVALLLLVDYEFCLRAILNTPVYFIPEKLVTFRVHHESETFKENESLTKRVKIQLIEPTVLFHEYLFNIKFKKIRKKIGILSLFRSFISVYRFRSKVFDYDTRRKLTRAYFRQFRFLPIMVFIAEISLVLKSKTRLI